MVKYKCIATNWHYYTENKIYKIKHLGHVGGEEGHRLYKYDYTNKSDFLNDYCFTHHFKRYLELNNKIRVL
jgi:hypothetical protein